MGRKYSDLFTGKVKYHIISHLRTGVGKKKAWWKVFVWNLTHCHNKLPYGYSHYNTHYIIVTAATGEWLGMRLKWDKDDMEEFAKDVNLQIGDEVSVYFKAQNRDGSHWNAGGLHYVITEEGWKKIDRILGA